MLSCKEIVKIISSEERPTWRRKLEVRFHLMMCRHCKKYAKQLDLLKEGFQKLFRTKLKEYDERKVRDLEDRVINKLKK